MSTAKHTAIILTAAAFALSAATAVTPATATPPHAEEDPAVAAVFPDTENGLVGYLNFTRAEFCAWEAGGFVGPPPFLESSSSWLHVTGTGEVSGTARGELPLELWPLDADAALESSCEDTSDATEPFATGHADVRAGQLALEGDDGHGAWVGRMGFKADLTAPDGSRYGYHVHVIEMADGKGRVRHLDSAHMRLTKFP